MTTPVRNLIIIAALAPALGAAEPATPPLNSASLILSPARCVALHQGQVCYQNVQFSWSSSSAGNYCLYQQDQPAPLHCWTQQAEATLEIEFAADNSRLYVLKDHQGQALAEATLEVAWVYKTNTRRKTHWRLF